MLYRWSLTNWPSQHIFFPYEWRLLWNNWKNYMWRRSWGFMMFPDLLFWVNITGSPPIFGKAFGLLWARSWNLAQLFIRKQTVRRRLPIRHLRICFEFVPLTSKRVGVSFCRGLSLFITIVLKRRLEWLSIRHFTEDIVDSQFIGMRLGKRYPDFFLLF